VSETRYYRHPDLRLLPQEGEGIVLHLGERRHFSVSDAGLVLLEALKEPRTFGDLVEGLLAHHETDRDVATETARAFLDQCLASAVVVEAGE
jgi:coenzyme PQQ synthesis protein D (PqqD)